MIRRRKGPPGRTLPCKNSRTLLRPKGGVSVHDRIAVVGASGSGCLTAALAARAGFGVDLYERTPDIDPAPRTLIVTHRMRDLFSPLGESAVVNEIRRYELLADGRHVEFPLSAPDLIVERSALIREFAKEALGTGVSIHCSHRLEGMRAAGDGIELTFSEGQFLPLKRVRSRVVVGADGGCSRVAREAGWPPQPKIPLLQAIVELPADLPPDTTRVWFKTNDTPYFFWLIPESESRGALGIIGERGSDIRGALDGFLRDQDLKPLEYQGAMIPYYERWVPPSRTMGNGKVYLVGDAAGQVKVSTVGGLVTGLRGAQVVADAITGRRSLEKIKLRLELDAHRLLRTSMHGYSNSDYVQLLDGLGRSTTVLSNSSRDRAAAMMMRLLLADPRLGLRFVSGLVRSRRARSRSIAN